MENSNIVRYIRLGIVLALVYLLNFQASHLYELFHKSLDPHLAAGFFVLSSLFVLSFIVHYLSEGTSIPSFVIAIFFGMAARDVLAPIIGSSSVLGEIVGLGATLILFGGGIETPWENFKRLLAKILSLSFVGLIFTAILFSFAVSFLGRVFGIDIPVTVSILLGAVLASTDPASIIPILKQFRFKNRDTRDIIVSESAVTDVTGTLLTVILISLLSAGMVFTSISGGYTSLLSKETLVFASRQIVFGAIFGVVGWLLLDLLSRFKKQHDQEFEADAAFFLFVPVVIFTFALIFGGSGYLAAFIAGLLFVLSERLHVTEKFFNQTIEGFLKPAIFLLLGALVEPHALLTYAPIGIAAALVFMFIIRPLSVFLTLGPFFFFGKNKLGWRELVFISCVRETGAIPAVLLVTIVASGIAGLDGLVPIGMWVILGTLILQPPLTPLVAKFLKVGTPIGDAVGLHINGGTEPFVVLGSRGESYVQRLPVVVEWAEVHGIRKVVLLHCLEDKYSSVLAEEIGIQAEGEFAKINRERDLRRKLPIKFAYVSRKGFLQENINELATENKNATVVFAGKRVLDFRLSEIKQLSVPLYFID